MRSSHSNKETEFEHVAGNGLLHRRALLGRGAAFAGALGTAVVRTLSNPNFEPLATWMRAEATIRTAC